MDKPIIKLYGTGWCPKSANLRNYLQSKWIDFEDYNVETDEKAAREVKKLYDGQLKFPTLILGTDHLKNPSIPELNALLKKYNLL